MRERVALRFAAIVGDSFVASGEADWLEAEESDLLRIIERELNDASDLLVVDAVNDGHDRNDFDSGAMQIIDGLEFYVEEVADFAVRIGCVADAVELQIRITQSGFGSLLRKLEALGEFNSVGRGLNRVVSNFAG